MSEPAICPRCAVLVHDAARHARWHSDLRAAMEGIIALTEHEPGCLGNHRGTCAVSGLFDPPKGGTDELHLP